MLSDSRRLWDLSARLALYSESVKANEVAKFHKNLGEVKYEVTETLRRLKYKNMDGLTKAELGKLLRELRKTQKEIYSRHLDDLIKAFEAFMNVELILNRRVWATALKEEDGKPMPMIGDGLAIQMLKEQSGPAIYGIAGVTGRNDILWSKILNAPIPANGFYIEPFLATFSVSAQASVENAVTRAWANRLSVEETIAELFVESQYGNGGVSQFDKILSQSATVINTSMAHVNSIVGIAALSALFGSYVWNSVIDSGTTTECRRLNGKVFIYGEGPEPPLHFGCRSSTAPWASNSDTQTETYYTWLKRQPAKVQDFALGASGAAKLRTGKLSAEDLKKFEVKHRLTLKQIEEKLSEILST